MNRFVLLLAQGFGAGLVPVVPGTVGSLVGMAWVLILLAAANPWVYWGLSLASLAVSVFCCGRAETFIATKDPGSVVLDEIVAMPFCFAWWIIYWQAQNREFPGLELLLSRQGVGVMVICFLLFRLLDVWKPGFIRRSQSLPGGWGITADDLLAASGVNLCGLAWLIWSAWPIDLFS